MKFLRRAKGLYFSLTVRQFSGKKKMLYLYFQNLETFLDESLELLFSDIEAAATWAVPGLLNF